MPIRSNGRAQRLALRSLPLFLTLFMMIATPALAADAADSVLTRLSEGGARDEPARLVLNNREIAELRTTYFGYTPKERVEKARERLRAVIGEHPRSDQTVSVDATKNELGWIFSVDGQWVFGLANQDLAALGGETPEQVVARTKKNLEAAVAASLAQRSTSALIRSILFSVLATGLLWFLLWGLGRLRRWAGGRLERALHARAGRSSETHIPMFRQLESLSRGILRALRVIFALVLIDGWLTFVLKQFPYTYPWGDQIDDFLIRAVTGIGLAILRAIPSLVILAIIFLIARFVVKWVQLLFGAAKEGRIELPGVDPDTAIPAQRLVVLLIWVITIAVAYPLIPGSQGVAFKGVSVLLGVMLSLGSSNVVSQAASGYMLMFSKALRVNDYVRIGEHEGTIVSIGMLSTKMRTPRDEEINVPNSVIVGTTVKNYTRLNRATGAPVTTAVTIGYSAPWRQVHAMLLDAAAHTAGLRRDPPPKVLQTALSDFYVEYTLFARLEVPQARAAVLSDLHANIQDTFNVHGVQIMSPHYEGDPADKVWVPKENWDPAGHRPGPDPSSTSKGSS